MRVNILFSTPYVLPTLLLSRRSMCSSIESVLCISRMAGGSAHMHAYINTSMRVYTNNHILRIHHEHCHFFARVFFLKHQHNVFLRWQSCAHIVLISVHAWQQSHHPNFHVLHEETTKQRHLFLGNNLYQSRRAFAEFLQILAPPSVMAPQPETAIRKKKSSVVQNMAWFRGPSSTYL